MRTTFISFCDDAFLFSPLILGVSTAVIFVKAFLHTGHTFVTLLQSCMHCKQNSCSHAIFPLFSTSPRQIVQISFVVIIDNSYSPARSAIDLQLPLITVVRKKLFELRIFKERLPFSSTQCDAF